MKLGRKFYIAVIYSVSLLGVLVFMVLRLGDKFTEVMFGAWLAAFGTGVVTYVMGNAAVSKNISGQTPPTQ